MNSEAIQNLLVSVAIAAIGLVISYFLDIIVLGCVSFGINWASFLFYAWPFHTEMFYDFTGSITFSSLVTTSILLHVFDSPATSLSARQSINSACVYVWCTRLGTYLYSRISKDKVDHRFDKARDDFFMFLMFWTIQGLWVILTALPVFIANTKFDDVSIQAMDIIGWTLWIIGFSIEVASDRQKDVFRQDPENKGKWIESGLWRYSRHPNYFGEITLWIGSFLSCATLFQPNSIDWLGIVSPVLVITLLCFVSGIPLLERSAQEKWGSDQDYQHYKRSTSILIPLPKWNN